jgi:cytochrome c biogenesis protein
MTQVPGDDGKPALVRLKPGQTHQLPGGRGSITFEEVKRFAGLSIRTDPGAPISLVSALLATLGLILGLTIKRRRVFVRVRPAGAGDAEPGATVVTIGGLSKDSDPGLAAVVDSVGAAVHDPHAERTDRS